MEINITRFFVDDDHAEYSGSIMERGLNAGPETWANAKERASREPHLLNTDAERAQWRQDLIAMGFSEGEETTTDPLELEALLIQYIAGDIRESGITENSMDEFAAWEERSDGGGRMFRGDDGEVYYCLGT